MWLTLAIFSSILLGFYDVLKKSSLKSNAFIPVLFIATTSGTIIFAIILTLSRVGLLTSASPIYVPSITPHEHLLFFIKSVIVGVSWFFAYMGMSKLPITIVVPIRATGPVWVILGAMLIFNERFTLLQWVGIVVVLVFFYAFSLAGKKEGIQFLRNKWIWAIVAATLFGAASGLYDKHLLQNYHRMAVQAWFSIYMFVVMLFFLLTVWYPKRSVGVRFQWKYSIPAIGIMLSLADYFYFQALSNPDSLIGVVSLVRRGSVVIAFGLGAVLFKERNIKSKLYALVGIMIGIVLLVLGS